MPLLLLKDGALKLPLTETLEAEAKTLEAEAEAEALLEIEVGCTTMPDSGASAI